MEESKSADDDLSSMISDDESISQSPNAKNVPKIQFTKHPKNIREFAAKIRKIERKIMLGLLTDAEESKLKSSKYFSKRFEKLLNLSTNNKKENLYKLVTNIKLNRQMIDELQKKKTSPNIRKKIQTKINNLSMREKNVQDKVKSGTLSQNDVDSFLRDMYFNVNFEDIILDHPPNSQVEQESPLAPASEDFLCDYCQSSNKKNQLGQSEDLLVCKDCSNKAHPSCLSYSPELVEQIRSDGSWQCIDCKACSICEGTGDPDSLLFCDACDKGYHMQCHTPKLEETPSGKWVCSACLAKGKSVASTSSTKQVLVIDDDRSDNKMDISVPVTLSQVDKDVTMVNVTAITTVPTVEATPVVTAPRRVIEPNAVIGPTIIPTQPGKLVPPSPPVISVKPSNFIYHPSGLTYAPLPPGSTAVSLPHGHPGSVQHQLIPLNYMLPNGVSSQQIQQVPMTGVPRPQMMQTHPLPPGVVPHIQSPPVAAVQAQTVMGKGVHNDLSNILNPKVPLPDVRASIRDDVLRILPSDVADWTVQNVAYYFKAHGYVHESKLLEEQEIDGRAMLLMSRNDCLTGLRIKLGPALKIYHMHVHKLQKRTDFLG